MKEMNSLETRLRSWRPRRPSARLKRRHFSARPGAPRRNVAWLLGWLAPAAACVLLTVLALNSDNGLSGCFPRHGIDDRDDFEQPELRGVCGGRFSKMRKTICPASLLIGQTAAFPF